MELMNELVAKRRLPEALQLLLDMLKNAPKSTQVRMEMVPLIAALGDFEEAIAQRQRVLEKIVMLEENEQAVDLLILLYIQQDNEAAQELLHARGYTHRLSSHVLKYDTGFVNPVESPVCWAFDNAFDKPTFKALETFFAPGSQYWTQNTYNELKSTGYFSNVFDMSQSRFVIEQVIQELFKLVAEVDPERAKKIQMAEWWAHCRPHHHGHQMHYDSENEGEGQLRHPLFSAVVYLSENVGGPTLVTDQILKKPFLARKGWMVYPKKNRVTIFDSQYLHGVVPGHGHPHNRNDRRVSFMVGFWDTITIQDKPTRGASRPLPLEASWVSQAPVCHASLSPKRQKVLPTAIPEVWVRSDGTSLDRWTLPPYEKCFQGF